LFNNNLALGTVNMLQDLWLSITGDIIAARQAAGDAG